MASISRGEGTGEGKSCDVVPAKSDKMRQQGSEGQGGCFDHLGRGFLSSYISPSSSM